MASKLSLFLAEFRRRKVGRVAVVYVLVGLGAIEAVDNIGSGLLFPQCGIVNLSPVSPDSRDENECKTPSRVPVPW